MERFVKGDVVVALFPFSDLSLSKKRPTLVITDLDGDDYILCQITSKLIFDKYSVSLNEIDFQEGTLKQVSFIRPNRLFTCDRKIILYKIGSLKENKINEVINFIINIIKN